EREASTDLGTGSIDYPQILKVAADNGMQYYILEQERYDNSTPLDSARVGAEYLSKLVFA
ncbi:MAG: sugar phosphate isomerase/epimerase, partial [Bacteroidota bacterium]